MQTDIHLRSTRPPLTFEYMGVGRFSPPYKIGRCVQSQRHLEVNYLVDYRISPSSHEDWKRNEAAQFGVRNHLVMIGTVKPISEWSVNK